MLKPKTNYFILFFMISIVATGCSFNNWADRVTDKNKEEVKTSQKQEEKYFLPEPKLSPCVTFVKPVPNGSVKGFPIPVEIVVDNTGNKGCIWTVFEGSAGNMKLVNRFGETVSTGTLMTDGDWMKEGPITFKGVIGDEKVAGDQIYRLILTEENPSGEGIPDEVIIKLYY